MMLQSLKDKFKILILIIVIINVRISGLIELVCSSLQLRRSVLACLLWEDQFYEDGVEIAGRIQSLVPREEGDHVYVFGQLG